jgi:tripartite-type tricarboxylate transporter receptor subunit TctC
MTTFLSRRAAFTSAFAAGAAALAMPQRTGLADALASQRNMAARSPTPLPARTAAARIVVPFAAGGAADVLARVVADILNQRMGETFAVENWPDAAGNTSAEIVARAAPDGRTLLLGTIGTAVTNQYLQKDLNYDSTESFVPVARVGEMATVLVVHRSFPAKTLEEFIARAKGFGPGGLAYASPGPGSAGHLAMEYLQNRAGFRLASVAQRPRTRVLEELLSGQTLVAMDCLPAYQKHIQSGELRALAICSANRWFAAPEIPTVAEQGFGAYDATLWWYVAAPAGTRRDTVAGLSNEIVTGLKMRASVARLRAVGIQERPGTSEDLALHIAAENLKWKKVIASAGLVPQ